MANVNGTESETKLKCLLGKSNCDGPGKWCLMTEPMASQHSYLRLKHLVKVVTMIVAQSPPLVADRPKKADLEENDTEFIEIMPITTGHTVP